MTDRDFSPEEKERVRVAGEDSVRNLEERVIRTADELEDLRAFRDHALKIICGHCWTTHHTTKEHEVMADTGRTIEEQRAAITIERFHELTITDWCWVAEYRLEVMRSLRKELATYKKLAFSGCATEEYE